MSGGYLALLAAIATVGGCLNAPQAPPLGTAASEPLLAPVKLLEGGFEIEVPVQVVLLGFPSGTAEALAGKLPPYRVEHDIFSFNRAVPPDGDLPLSGTPLGANPVIPVAVYDVEDGGANLTSAYFALAAASTVSDGIHDANALEDFLAVALPENGFPLDPNAPTLVLVHAGEALGEHAYRLTLPNGYLEPVRVFGERAPLLVLDVSAEPDPYVVTTDVTGRQQETEAYNLPVEATNVDALALAVVDATDFRLLTGPIYPVATAPCHAVTYIFAIRSTALSPYLPGYKSAEEHLDEGAQLRALQNLTGTDRVFLDVKVLRLPVDDPPLEAVIPRSIATLDPFRFYMDLNWEKYWVPHEGCEPYLALTVFGDAAESQDFGGIAMYDVKRSHRIAFGISGDLDRIIAGSIQETLFPTDGALGAYDYVNRVFLHETGHLLGTHHPHSIAKSNPEGTQGTDAFSSVYSVMSYQTSYRLFDFSSVDAANHARNRAGAVVAAAQHAGLEDTPEFEEALGHLRLLHWQAAADALTPLLGEHEGDCAGRC